MLYQTESKPQCWRAVAVFQEGGQRLLFLGRSSTQVRAGYSGAYFDLVDDDERDQVKTISMQRWEGAADAGKWLEQNELNVPSAARQLLKVA